MCIIFLINLETSCAPIGIRGAIEQDKRRKELVVEAEDAQKRNILKILERIETKGTFGRHNHAMH